MLSARELEIRKRFIGSSDIPAIIGVSPWKSAAHVLETKLDPTKVLDTPSFQLGHKLERPIAELALVQGQLDEIGKILVGGWTVTDGEWCSATPDFYVLRTGSETYRKRRPLREEEAAILEIKLVGWRVLNHWDYGDKLPDYVAAQVQWQMMVCKHQKAYVVALLGGSDIKLFPVERNDVWIARMKKEARRFYKTHLAEGKRDKIAYRVLYEKLRARLRSREAA